MMGGSLECDGQRWQVLAPSKFEGPFDGGIARWHRRLKWKMTTGGEVSIPSHEQPGHARLGEQLSTPVMPAACEERGWAHHSSLREVFGAHSSAFHGPTCQRRGPL